MEGPPYLPKSTKPFLLLPEALMPDYDFANARRYEVVRTGLKPPSSNWSDIKCPWCGQTVRAYWWSIAGGGKKCPCGAKHSSLGVTARTKPKKGKPE